MTAPTLFLGHDPNSMVLQLNTTEDFSQAFQVTDTSGNPVTLSDGLVVTLEFATGQVWTATIDGAGITFAAAAADADLISAWTAVSWVFTQNGSRLIYAEGRVHRD